MEQAQAAEAAGNSKLVEQYKWQCERIIGFTEYRFPRYRPSRHHRMIAEQLERVERGEIDRLMLRLPPRQCQWHEEFAVSSPEESLGQGGDVLGRGAHIWLIDDPFGKMADAQSPVMRENVWRWREVGRSG